MPEHNPFTTTPGVAGEAYINPHYADEIINEFSSPYSTQYIYKILGLRGSGKSVEYAKVMNHFSALSDWKVYGLSAAGSPVKTLITSIVREYPSLYSHKQETKEVSGEIGGSLLSAISGKGAYSSKTSIEDNEIMYASDEATLTDLCIKLSKDYHILIGIDDIAKTQGMVEFLSILGALIMNNKVNIRLVCTGLYKNIEDFTNEMHLSFFVRPKSLEVKAIDDSQIALMYQNLLGINTTDAKEIAQVVKGYAWGYQLMGDILYNQKAKKLDDDILEEFDARIAQTYSLVWNSITDTEKECLSIIVLTDSEKRSDIEAAFVEKYNKGGFGTLKSRLESKHIIRSTKSGTEGYIKVNLPRLKEYIVNWAMPQIDNI